MGKLETKKSAKGQKTVKSQKKSEKARESKKASDISRPPATTMDELLRQEKYKLRTFKRGQPVEGIIIEKTKKAIYIDIGGKTEGMVIDREMKAARDFIAGLQVGDKVTAIVTQPENEAGHTLLSLKKAAADSVWLEFEEKLKTGETVRVLGKEVNKGGLVVEAKGLAGFIPASQFGAAHQGNIDQLVGKQIEVKTIEVDRAASRLIFSEKEVSEASLLKEQAQLLGKIKIGDVFSGEVSGVMPFGLFVKIKAERPGEEERGGKKEKTSSIRSTIFEGLVHISEISWEKVANPADYYKVGDKIKVKVLAVDKKSGRLNLSIKQLLPDPWAEVEKKYPPDSKIRGEIVRIAPFGVFVKLEPGIEALIHISKIPAEKVYKVGEKIDCFVESVDKVSRKMSLGLVLKEKPIGYK